MLDLDTVFIIAEESDLLDRVEAALRSAGQNFLADHVVKLQQDAGVEIDREMSGGEGPAPGPQTAALRAAYQETDVTRLDIFYQALCLLSGHDKGEMESFIKKLPCSANAQSVAQPRLKP